MFHHAFSVYDRGYAHASELLPTYLCHQAFTVYDWGYASAIAVAAFLISLIAAAAYMLVLRRQETSA